MEKPSNSHLCKTEHKKASRGLTGVAGGEGTESPFLRGVIRVFTVYLLQYTFHPIVCSFALRVDVITRSCKWMREALSGNLRDHLKTCIVTHMVECEKQLCPEIFSHIFGDCKVDDKKLVLDAVKRAGGALRYASYNVRSDEHIAVTALRNTFAADPFIPESLRAKCWYKVCLEVCTRTP